MRALWIWRVLVIIGILAIAGELAGIRKELAAISALVAQLRTELTEDDDDDPPRGGLLPTGGQDERSP